MLLNDDSPNRLSRRQVLATSSSFAAGALAAANAAAADLSADAPAGSANTSTELAPSRLAAVLAQAEALPRLHSLLIARHGRELVAARLRGPALDTPVNVKSVSKSVIAALVGAAIGRGVLGGVDQPITTLLDGMIPQGLDPRISSITVADLLTMQAGLERTSGPNYGSWVASPDWVRYVLTRPFVREPGQGMLYSTGSYHLLSVALSQVSGESTLALARTWLGAPLDIQIPPWTRDPQGFYMGGNNMALAPRALLRFGEMYRQGGVYDGTQVLPADWIESSWTARTRSVFTGHGYGYGWFLVRARGYRVAYAWGYGGQMIYVVPALGLTVAITSDPNAPSGRTGYVRQLHALMADGIIPAAEDG
ncbi:MAG: serine hydrolase [Pseudomonadota bacterium]